MQSARSSRTEGRPRFDRSLIVVVAAVVIGGLLRAFDLGKQPLWLDEMASFDFAGLPFSECVFAEAQHPPLYRTMLWGFRRLFGDSDAIVRIPSMLFGTATIAVCCLFARRLRPEALTRVAFLVTASPFLYYYSRENRNYALLILLSIWSTMAVHRVIRDGRSRFGYGLLSVLLAYTHYFGAFVLLAHEWVYWRSRSRGESVCEPDAWLRMRMLSALAVVPWAIWLGQNLEMKPRDWLLDPFSATLMMLLRMFGGYGIAPWRAASSYERYDAVWFVDSIAGALVVVPAIYCVVRGLRLRGRDSVGTGLLRTEVCLPFVILVPMALEARFISDRYLAFLAPFLIVACGIGWSLQRRGRRVLDAVLVGATLFALASHVFAPGSLLGYPLRFKKEQWPEAAAYVHEFKPQKIVYCHEYVRPVFNRYYGWQDGADLGMPVERLALVLSHQSPEEEVEMRERLLVDYEILREARFPAHSGIKVLCLVRRTMDPSGR